MITFNCEADKYKSIDNKNDLISLIVKYKIKKSGERYRKKDFKLFDKRVLKGIFNEI